MAQEGGDLKILTTRATEQLKRINDLLTGKITGPPALTETIEKFAVVVDALDKFEEVVSGGVVAAVVLLFCAKK